MSPEITGQKSFIASARYGASSRFSFSASGIMSANSAREAMDICNFMILVHLGKQVFRGNELIIIQCLVGHKNAKRLALAYQGRKNDVSVDYCEHDSFLQNFSVPFGKRLVYFVG